MVSFRPLSSDLLTRIASSQAQEEKGGRMGMDMCRVTSTNLN
jgi:hypothetical protein